MKIKYVVVLSVLFLSTIIAFYISDISFNRLYAEIEIKRWADRLRGQGGIGRYCASVNYSDINRIFESMGKEKIKDVSGVVSINSPSCWSRLQLVEMTYYANYEVLSAVYRCETDEIVQELQLAKYLEPNLATQNDYCKAGTFQKAWNVPVGEATMFSAP